MSQMTMIEAINDALMTEMEKDERVVVFGEDIGRRGGVFLATANLIDKFGEERVFDTPLSESAIIGVALGLAMNGFRPVAEIQFIDFIFGGAEQLISNVAKWRYRTGGQFAAPLVIRSPYGGGIRGGMHHSQSPEAYFIHTAGLKVVVPSTPYEAKGLLISSIRDDDPVIFMEPKKVYRTIREDVPEGDYSIPLGKGRVVKEGDDVSVFSYGAMLHIALSAAKEVEREGITVEVIDLRTLMPYDGELILKSVEKTGRPIIVHEAPKICGFGAEISAFIAERAILKLQAPILRVTGYDTPFPLVHEKYYLPNRQRIIDAIKKSVAF